MGALFERPLEVVTDGGFFFSRHGLLLMTRIHHTARRVLEPCRAPVRGIRTRPRHLVTSNLCDLGWKMLPFCSVLMPQHQANPTLWLSTNRLLHVQFRYAWVTSPLHAAVWRLSPFHPHQVIFGYDASELVHEGSDILL